MKVTDPGGRTWRVTRRWTPWRRRIKDVTDVSPDLSAGDLGDDPVSLVLWLVVGILLLPVVVGVLLVGLELLLLLVLLPVAVLVRVLLGRRWVVEVREGFRPRYEEPTGDWRAAGERIVELARGIEQGTFTVPRDPTDPDRLVRHDPGPQRRPGQEW